MHIHRNAFTELQRHKDAF